MRSAQTSSSIFAWSAACLPSLNPALRWVSRAHGWRTRRQRIRIGLPGVFPSGSPQAVRRAAPQQPVPGKQGERPCRSRPATSCPAPASMRRWRKRPCAWPGTCPPPPPTYDTDAFTEPRSLARREAPRSRLRAVRLAPRPRRRDPAPRRRRTTSPLNAEVADLLERLADATSTTRKGEPTRREAGDGRDYSRAAAAIATIPSRRRRLAQATGPHGHVYSKRQAKLTKSYREELRLAATGGDNKWDCCDCARTNSGRPHALRLTLLGRDGQRRAHTCA